jgi:hypothetical protein
VLSRLYDLAKGVLKVSGVVGGIGGAVGLLAKTPPAKKFQQEIEDYLRRTGEEELRPEVLKAELDEIFKNPSSAMEILKNKASSFDRDTVISLVAAKEGLSREDAIKAADKVQEAIENVREKVRANIDLVESKARQAKDSSAAAAGNKKSQAMDWVNDKKDQALDWVSEKKDEALEAVEERIKAFLDKVDKPELNYGRLKLELGLILKHPELTPEILRAKFAEFDTDTMVALLAANNSISKDEAVNITRKFLEAKMEVESKLDLAEAKVKRNIDEAKAFALREAEITRESAVAASWWLFGAMVISGAAAVIAGILAL